MKYPITVFSELDEKILDIAAKHKLIIIGGTAIELIRAKMIEEKPFMTSVVNMDRERSDNDFDFLIQSDMSVNLDELVKELSELGFSIIGGGVNEPVCFFEAKDSKGNTAQIDLLTDFNPVPYVKTQKLYDLIVIENKSLIKLKEARLKYNINLSPEYIARQQKDIAILDTLYTFRKAKSI